MANKHEVSIPVGMLSVVGMRGCEDVCSNVDAYLSEWRAARHGKLTADADFNGYIRDSYLLKTKCPRFGSGEGKGVVIEDNVFETFDAPIVYAKSIDGLVFRNNKIIQNNDFKPFHWNRHRFLLEKVTNVTIEENEFEGGFDKEKDVMYRY